MLARSERTKGAGIPRSVRKIVNPFSRNSFILDLPPGSSVLDVGCGNNSPRDFKTFRPDIRYTGIDVTDYLQAEDPNNYADQYILVAPENFHKKISEFVNVFDAVISSHNLEHCNEPNDVLRAIARALKPGGRLFLAFPAEHTDRLPSRGGCLNFYDDPTHRWLPKYQEVLSVLRDENVTPIAAFPKYRPPFKVLAGLAFEPLSWWKNHTMMGTWALYGFETVIWGEKKTS